MSLRLRVQSVFLLIGVIMTQTDVIYYQNDSLILCEFWREIELGRMKIVRFSKEFGHKLEFLELVLHEIKIHAA